MRSPSENFYTRAERGFQKISKKFKKILAVPNIIKLKFVIGIALSEPVFRSQQSRCAAPRATATVNVDQTRAARARSDPPRSTSHGSGQSTKFPLCRVSEAPS